MVNKVATLRDEHGIRACEIIEPGEFIQSYSPYSVKPYKGSIGTALVSERLLREFEQLLKISPTGCVLLLGSSYGGTYYFQSEELWRRWHEASNTNKTADYPGALERTGAVVQAAS